MADDNWEKAMDFFLTEEHIKTSQRNKSNRQKQTTKNRGGSATYYSSSHKNKWDRIEAWRRGKVGKVGQFDSPQMAQKYDALKNDVQEQTQISSAANTPVNMAPVFKKHFGVRRGIVRGIGRKPPHASTVDLSCFGESPSQSKNMHV